MTISLTDLPVEPLIAGLSPVRSFLTIDDIPGDSTSARHEDSIDVFSFSWEVARSSARVGSGRARSRSSLSPLRVRCALDSSGPLLFRAVAQGRSFPTAVLEATATSGPVVLSWRMDNIVISSYALTSVGTQPVQSFEIEAEEVTFTYRRVSDDGSTGGEVSHSWDVTAGR